VHKKILFPFSPGKSLNSGYAWAMQLAARMNAPLFFFTTVPANEKNKDQFLHHVHCSLLEAQGSYLQYTSQRRAPARTEPHIEQGDFTGSLSQFLKRIRFDIVVIDPQTSGLPKTSLKYVVENSNGVIVLPDQPENSYHSFSTSTKESEKKITESFYSVLHHSDLYKLQDNFFHTLGKDKGVFNYLRSLFEKKRRRSFT